MHPVFTQVPPRSLRSTSAVLRPAFARRTASAGPACPAPMTISSKSMTTLQLLGRSSGILILRPWLWHHVRRLMPRKLYNAKHALHGQSSCAHRTGGLHVPAGGSLELMASATDRAAATIAEFVH